MAPPADQPARRVQFLADLSLEVDDGRGQTSARVTASGSNLVLDVADPMTLWRALPVGEARAFTRQLPTDGLDGASLEITSQGRRLATLTVSARRRLRIRPTRAGLSTLASPVTSSPAVRTVVAGLVAVAVAAALRLRRDRRAAS